MKLFLLFLLVAHGSILTVQAAPRFAHIFGDHAVLQRDSEIRIWGKGAEKGAQLKLRLGESIIQGRGGGRWTLGGEAPAAGGRE